MTTAGADFAARAEWVEPASLSRRAAFAPRPARVAPRWTIRIRRAPADPHLDCAEYAKLLAWPTKSDRPVQKSHRCVLPVPSAAHPRKWTRRFPPDRKSTR